MNFLLEHKSHVKSCRNIFQYVICCIKMRFSRIFHKPTKQMKYFALWYVRSLPSSLLCFKFVSSGVEHFLLVINSNFQPNFQHSSFGMQNFHHSNFLLPNQESDSIHPTLSFQTELRVRIEALQSPSHHCHSQSCHPHIGGLSYVIYHAS